MWLYLGNNVTPYLRPFAYVDEDSWQYKWMGRVALVVGKDVAGAETC